MAVQALSDKMRATGEDQLATVARLAEELSQRMSSIIEARVVFKLDTPDTDKFVGANTGINIDDGGGIISFMIYPIPGYMRATGLQRISLEKGRTRNRASSSSIMRYIT